MLITCNNKGCMKQSEAKYDVSKDVVVCEECKKPIKNISASMRLALKTVGQILKEQKNNFIGDCKTCGAKREAVLNKLDDVVCKICQSPIKVPITVKQLLINKKISKV